MSKACHPKTGWLSGQTYCAVHGRSASWPCQSEHEPVTTYTVRSTWGMVLAEADDLTKINTLADKLNDGERNFYVMHNSTLIRSIINYTGDPLAE